MKMTSYYRFLLAVSICFSVCAPATGAESFTNPVIGGDYPDPTILREGDDYYMTHSAFDYQPGLTVFHSQDLVHWEPVSYALTAYLGSVWAPDISKYQDKYYIYFTVSLPEGGRKTNYVTYADSPYGPWSEPIDLKIGNIDPCHVVGEDGQRWLFMSGGQRVKLASDGLSVLPETMEKIYDGWHYPSDWVTEGFALEGPKVRKIGDYYYYLNAEGGTAGPPTAHMVVMARSKSIDGPWENSPYNPIIRCYQASDRWWNKGHGSLIDTPDGHWYCIYHAYENGFTDLGRQTLLEPLEMTADGWFVPKIRDQEGKSADPVRPMPIPVETNWKTAFKSKEDCLSDFRLGLEWKFYKQFDPNRVSVSKGELTLQAQGTAPGNSSPLMFVAGERRYELECEVELNDPEASAGLVLYYDSVFFMGTGANIHQRLRYRKGTQKGGARHPQDVGVNVSNQDVRRIWLRLRNDGHIVTGQYSYDGEHWQRESWGMDCGGYNHNTLYQFQSVLPGVFVFGKGSATFRNFKYRNLDKEEARQAMLKATRFMMDSVSYEGGFVWGYLPDLSRQWAEVEAPRRTFVWIQQPGTPSVGHLLLDAYHATEDAYFKESALKVADMLLRLQLPCGGWNYMYDLAGEDSLKTFYETYGRQAWRIEEFHYYYGNATFDDSNTSTVATFLLRLYLDLAREDGSLNNPKKKPSAETQKVKAGLDQVIRFVLDSQYSNGGWPQRFPLRYDHPFEGRADYTSFVTLNDDVMTDNVDFLLQCYQALGMKKLLKPIRKAMYLMAALQQPAPLSGWADQYDPKTLKPAHARSFEPRSVNTGTTVRMIGVMEKYYQLTGDAFFLKGIPAAIRFLEAQRLPADQEKLWGRPKRDSSDFLVPRFLLPEVGTLPDGRPDTVGTPLYVHRVGGNVGNGHYYTDQDITGTPIHYSSATYVNTNAIRKQYEAVKAMSAEVATQASPYLHPDRVEAVPVYYYHPRPYLRGFRLPTDPADIIRMQQPSGAWLTPLSLVSEPFRLLPKDQPASTETRYQSTMRGDVYDSSPYPPTPDVIGINTQHYIQLMTQLIHFVK
ncbi:MAG: family 43 glycosylhydrolase [Bacteroidales bacterium]|nr:family 43 glycosylhydrolase [Bacteroidales bacterium]